MVLMREEGLCIKKKDPVNSITPEPGNDRLHAEVGGRGNLPFDWRTPEGRDGFLLYLFRYSLLICPERVSS